jgi:hypothetical protein
MFRVDKRDFDMLKKGCLKFLNITLVSCKYNNDGYYYLMIYFSNQDILKEKILLLVIYDN